MSKEFLAGVYRHSYLTFAMCWVITILLFLLGEFDVLPVGIFIEQAMATYISDTIAILSTAILVPMALKIFQKVLVQHIDKLAIGSAISIYKKITVLRAVALELVVVIGLFTYYLTLGNTGLFCALIGMISFLFCVPTKKRLNSELHLSKEE